MNEQYDEESLVLIVKQCRSVMKLHTISTRIKMQACYNLMEGVLRLFCIRGEKEDVLSLIQEINRDLIDSIQGFYK